MRHQLTLLWKDGKTGFILEITGKVTGDARKAQKAHGLKVEALKYLVYIMLLVLSSTNLKLEIY